MPNYTKVSDCKITKDEQLSRSTWINLGTSQITSLDKSEGTTKKNGMGANKKTGMT